MLLIFFQSTMAENSAVESSLRAPTADEVRTLSHRMGFVIREEEISVYQGIEMFRFYTVRVNYNSLSLRLQLITPTSTLIACVASVPVRGERERVFAFEPREKWGESKNVQGGEKLPFATRISFASYRKRLLRMLRPGLFWISQKPLPIILIVQCLAILTKLSTEAIASTLRDTYQRLYDLSEPRLPIKYPRERGYRPSPEENLLNAWLVV